MIAAILIAVIATQQIADGHPEAWVLMALAGIYVTFALLNAFRD